MLEQQKALGVPKGVLEDEFEEEEDAVYQSWAVSPRQSLP